MEKQTTNIRRLILGVALVATLFAVIWLEENDADIEETVQPILPTKPASKSVNVAGRKNDMGHLKVDQLGQRKFSAEADDIFASASWEPKQPRADLSQSPFGSSGSSNQAAKPAPVRAPPPAAPPLQFKYIGKIMEGKRTSIFLSMGDTYYVAKVGGHIEKNYRVDRINDDVIEFTYLPLGIKQTLLINNNNPGKF
ncbi:hypothetical protein [Nitrosomonas communis]|uniref:Prolin-rich transmembrane protein n=1 Tax=Nitrosomonas communis TaxID=44574 RepID=A0A1I4J171_9PROT|nr:hypothetical protein [Nitrosomonas communis]SFL60270.1 hypothetical protein SAMN05421863_1001144 [Nitrosomonas communis]